MIFFALKCSYLNSLPIIEYLRQRLGVAKLQYGVYQLSCNIKNQYISVFQKELYFKDPKSKIFSNSFKQIDKLTSTWAHFKE